MRAEVFEHCEGGKFGGDLGWGEEELEGFASELDAVGEGVPGELLEEGESFAGLAVVEDNSAAVSGLGDEFDGGLECGEGEIGDDSKPGEEGGGLRFEACSGELLRKGLALEVYRHEGE